MIQVIFAVSVVVAYLPFEQSDDNDKLMRAFSVSMVRSSRVSFLTCIYSSSQWRIYDANLYPTLVRITSTVSRKHRILRKVNLA